MWEQSSQSPSLEKQRVLCSVRCQIQSEIICGLISIYVYVYTAEIEFYIREVDMKQGASHKARCYAERKQGECGDFVMLLDAGSQLLLDMSFQVEYWTFPDLLCYISFCLLHLW